MLAVTMGGQGRDWGTVLAMVIVPVLCLAVACGRRVDQAVEQPSSPATVESSEVQQQLAADARALPSFDIEAGPGDLRQMTEVVLGTRRSTPVPTCGATHSYDYIASDVVCADGRSLFGGDLRAAIEARVGNVGMGPSGHIIDLYRIPCPEGPKEVYVDMYECENPWVTRSEHEMSRLMLGVLNGDYAPYIQRCREEESAGAMGRVSVLLQSCITGMPGVLEASGDRGGAEAWLQVWCASAGGKDEDGSPERFIYLNNVIESAINLIAELGRAEQEKASPEVRRSLTRDFAGVCRVDRKAFERWRSARSKAGD